MSTFDYPCLRSLLVDEESRVCFDARKAFAEVPSLALFYKIIRRSCGKYRFRDLEGFLCDKGVSSWIGWGSGDTALYHELVLTDSKYDYLGTCIGSSSTSGDRPTCILEVSKALDLAKSPGCGVLVNEEAFERDKKLLSVVPAEKLLIVKDHLVGRCGWQYFDYFQPDGTEYFVDAGCLDGGTSAAFASWCKGNYGHIYAFEPNPLSTEAYRKGMSVFGERATLYEYALLDRIGFTSFDAIGRSKWDARVDELGSTIVPCSTLDAVLGGRPVTYVKLDIEGCELRALIGGRGLLAEKRPRLAVSVYHEAEDLFAAMNLLRDMAAYSFAIRHYHSDAIETVLYAF
ncbi:MAG: FkbM family methyltransferase [Eggerthellaceae bacterium]|nr:FkbM family methyltransferase [Eggerthellaceae bacterium]